MPDPPLPPIRSPDLDESSFCANGGSSMGLEEGTRLPRNFLPRLRERRWHGISLPKRPPSGKAQKWKQQYTDRGSFELVYFDEHVDIRSQALEGIEMAFKGLGLTLPTLSIVMPSPRELREYQELHEQFYDGEHLDITGFREALDTKYANPSHRILAVVPGFTGCDLGESSNLQMGSMVVSIDQARSAPHHSLIDVVTHEEAHVLLERGHHAEEDAEVFNAGMVSNCVLASTYGRGGEFCDLCKHRAKSIEDEDKKHGLV